MSNGPFADFQNEVYLKGLFGELPTLREFTELTDVMKEVEFKVFSGPANAADGRVVAMIRAGCRCGSIESMRCSRRAGSTCAPARCSCRPSTARGCASTAT